MERKSLFGAGRTQNIVNGMKDELNDWKYVQYEQSYMVQRTGQIDINDYIMHYTGNKSISTLSEHRNKIGQKVTKIFKHMLS